MNIKTHSKNFELLKSHDKLINRQTQKIRKWLPTFDPEIVDLTVNIERLPRGSQYRTSLLLTIPQRSIRVEELEDNATTSIVKAFAELRRRVKRFKSQLNRERLWRREIEPEGVPMTPAAWEVEEALRDHMEKIENFIRREVYHQVIAGAMPPGFLEPHALVDDVFLHVRANYLRKPASLSIEQWVFQVVRETLRTQLQEIEDHRDEPHFEESAARVEGWEDEQMNFYQPDESLLVEDLLQDGQSSNPEEIMEKEEVEEQLHRSIARLPASLRESFVLFALEGFTSDEVAMMTGKSPDEVVKDVESARSALRKDMKL
ncbi:MAG TPA: HPF/RaiA family ribosome-associated protein [Acidobacteriota bacterium]|nr:HPF/RaiA family ribosome-associated protein [Acidobacteriota bacterium]